MRSDGSDPAVVAWVGLGGNWPQTPRLFQGALRRLQSQALVHKVVCSPLYLTEPVGPVCRQRWFLNGVIRIETGLGPRALLRLLHRIERSAGRNRKQERRWGPRGLDLDLLFYGARRICDRRLIVPHPRAHQRRFVLQPMVDLAPEWIHPGCGKTIDTLLQKVDDTHLTILWDGWARTLNRSNASRAATRTFFPDG
ncbi:MAG: 2-amino-4-hydroxy-6-hydroxymethyldihydropteridine diphosphokinase [Magnetococcales bacterium]|nr:2-amino-4-hydroxy-6-hydroxymethyldihydropteridine diphosphokinase [Magnetococcales bacterium]